MSAYPASATKTIVATRERPPRSSHVAVIGLMLDARGSNMLAGPVDRVCTKDEGGSVSADTLMEFEIRINSKMRRFRFQCQNVTRMLARRVEGCTPILVLTTVKIVFVGNFLVKIHEVSTVCRRMYSGTN